MNQQQQNPLKRPLVQVAGKRSKRKPPMPANTFHQENRLLVSRKTPFPAQIRKIEKLLLRQDLPCVEIHGLGAAVTRAVEIALHVQQVNTDAFERVDVDTSTVELVDDVLPDDHMNHDVIEDVRYNSAIKITLHKKIPIVYPVSKSNQPTVESVQTVPHAWANSAKIQHITAATTLTGPTDKTLVCMKKKKRSRK